MKSAEQRVIIEKYNNSQGPDRIFMEQRSVSQVALMVVVLFIVVVVLVVKWLEMMMMSLIPGTVRSSWRGWPPASLARTISRTTPSTVLTVTSLLRRMRAATR